MNGGHPVEGWDVPRGFYAPDEPTAYEESLYEAAEALADMEPDQSPMEPQMGSVTESIYNGKSITIPLADVQHVEKHNPLGLIVVTKHTRWDADAGCWANAAWIDKAEADGFTRAWCRYRSELEADTLADLAPAQTVGQPT